mgnify:CR=1 FL=1
MAEETTIPLENGSTSSSVSVGLESHDQSNSHVEPRIPSGAPAEDVEQLQNRITQLEQQNTQYKRERRGWEDQSRHNMTELHATRERLARLEGRLEPSTQQASEPERSTYTPGKLKSALAKWLNNDESEMNELEQVLGRQFSAQDVQATQAFKSGDVKRLVREELVELGTRGNVQTIVGTRHPDLANPQSDLSQAVWDEYDDYAASPENGVMYAKDERYQVPMIGPDGSQRMIDARLVDRLAADIRLRSGVQEGRKQESRSARAGGAQSGSGRTTRSPVQRSVEAAELLTPDELTLIHDPRVRKGWPKMPSDPKAASKYFFDGLPKEEQVRRIRAYRGE